MVEPGTLSKFNRARCIDETATQRVSVVNQVVIPIAVEGAARQRKRQAPKGRRVDATALAVVRSLLGDEPCRRDLLIEYLHLINDRFGQLSAQHLAALA